METDKERRNKTILFTDTMTIYVKSPKETTKMLGTNKQ
jgi:hypothetical protein